MMTKRTLVILLAAALVICAAFFAAVWNAPPGQSAIQVPDDMGGTFTLTNQDGKRESTEIYKGKYKLLYFGFTHCPAICPTELQKIARALQELGPQADRIQPLFVSVDPERDTPEILKDYIDLFGMNLTGYTGSVEEIETLKKRYRIYAAKTQEEGMSEYTVDHSSFIYLLDPDDKVVDLYKTGDTPEIIAERVKTVLPVL